MYCKKGKVDHLYRGSIVDPIAAELNRYYNTPLFIGPMPLAATYRRIGMKALARYQIILLGEQRHIGVNNLPKVVARQCSGRELNPRPLESRSRVQHANHYTTKPKGGEFEGEGWGLKL